MKKRFKIHKLHKQFVFDTIDDWFQCPPNTQVKINVSIVFDAGKNPSIIVDAWGNDDIGMILRIDCASFGEATQIFRRQVKNVQRKFPNPISQNWLKSQGFEFA